MNLDDSAKQMFERDQDAEKIRVHLRENLPIVLAMATHDINRPINNPTLIQVARLCATAIAIPLLPPEPKQE